MTPKRTLANYMILLYTSTWNFQLDERYDDIYQVKLLDFYSKKKFNKFRSKIYHNAFNAKTLNIPYIFAN